jgi:hypothetical protein
LSISIIPVFPKRTSSSTSTTESYSRTTAASTSLSVSAFASDRLSVPIEKLEARVTYGIHGSNSDSAHTVDFIFAADSLSTCAYH